MKSHAFLRALFFYTIFIVLLIVCWVLVAAGLLYTRGNTLLSAKSKQRVLPLDAEIAKTTEEKFFLHPLTGCVSFAEAALPPPEIEARSAVVIDARTGAVLYEKNPNQSIPPASLTKIVALYTAMEAVEAGEISLADTVIPPPASWAINIPPYSSLMFLGNHQTLTVKELLLGMSVVSGNDAAIALAMHTAGSVPAFVDRMNKTVKKIGLRNTSFEEPSGLSENNRTTARDFARFSYAYLKKYPNQLQNFHAVKDFTYPKPHNMLVRQPSIHQRATNTLLGKLDGCDGLKTGFIYESGFNIALTAERHGTRFIAVILGGAGKTSSQGKKIREQNGKALIEWAFSQFETKKVPLLSKQLSVSVAGSNEKPSCSVVYPIIKHSSDGSNAFFTVVRTSADSLAENQSLEEQIILPSYISAPIAAGEKIGAFRIVQKLGSKDYVIAEFPLVACRSFAVGSTFRWKYDHAALRFFSLVNSILPQ